MKTTLAANRPIGREPQRMADVLPQALRSLGLILVRTKTCQVIPTKRKEPKHDTV